MWQTLSFLSSKFSWCGGEVQMAETLRKTSFLVLFFFLLVLGFQRFSRPVEGRQRHINHTLLYKPSALWSPAQHTRSPIHTHHHGNVFPVQKPFAARLDAFISAACIFSFFSVIIQSTFLFTKTDNYHYFHLKPKWKVPLSQFVHVFVAKWSSYT